MMAPLAGHPTAIVRIGRWGLAMIIVASTAIVIISVLQHRRSFPVGVGLILVNVLVQGILELNERLLLRRHSPRGVVVLLLVGSVALVLVVALGIWDLSVLLGSR